MTIPADELLPSDQLHHYWPIFRPEMLVQTSLLVLFFQTNVALPAVFQRNSLRFWVAVLSAVSVFLAVASYRCLQLAWETRWDLPGVLVPVAANPVAEFAFAPLVEPVELPGVRSSGEAIEVAPLRIPVRHSDRLPLIEKLLQQVLREHEAAQHDVQQVVVEPAGWSDHPLRKQSVPDHTGFLPSV